MCTCERPIHFLHKNFSSSVFAVPGKCSKSGNTYFAAVPATEHINIGEIYVCVQICRHPRFPYTCVFTARPRNAVLCIPLRGYQGQAPPPYRKCVFSQYLFVDSGQIPGRFKTIKIYG